MPIESRIQQGCSESMHGIPPRATPLCASYGRNAGYPAPPARTRTCSFPASGSSVVLAFAQANGLIAISRSEVGSCDSSPACPARVSFAGYVLPSGPSPCGGLSPPPSTMPDKTPQGRIAAFCPPGAWFSGRALGSRVVPLSFPEDDANGSTKNQ